MHFLTSPTDAQPEAAVGNMDLDDKGDDVIDSEEESDDEVEEGEVRTCTAGA